MTKLIFISAAGLRREVEVTEGVSVMQVAVANGIDGMLAECGGSAMCATCHCYIDEAFADQLPEVSAIEAEMLNSTAAERRANSRLACQIQVTDAFDGLIIHLPQTQV